MSTGTAPPPAAPVGSVLAPAPARAPARAHPLTLAHYRSLGAAVCGALTSPPAAGAAPPRRLLCIVDLNGVLLERLSPGTASHRPARARAAALRPRDLRVDGRDVWLRPYRAELLRYISARQAAAVWSSATLRTVQGLVRADRVLQGTGLQPDKDLVFVRDRRHCRPDKQAGRFATVKPLGLVWADPGVAEGYSARNTLILEDTAAKVRAHPLNAVICPEYSAGNMRINYCQDETLLWVALYIEHISTYPSAGTDDVRQRVAAAGSLADFTLAGQRCAMTLTSRPSVRAFIPLAVVPAPVHRPPAAPARPPARAPAPSPPRTADDAEDLALAHQRLPLAHH